MMRVRAAFMPFYTSVILFIILVTPFVALPAPKQLMTLAVTGGVLSLIGFVIKALPRPIFPRPVILFLGGFFLWAGFATYLQGGDPYAYRTVIKALGISVSGFLMLAGARALGTTELNIIKKYFPYAFALALVLFAFDNLSDHAFLRFVHSGEAATDFADSKTNRAAVVLALFIWPAMAFLSGQNKKVYSLALFLFTFAALLTGESQSAFLGIAAGAAAFLMTRYKPKKVPLLLMGAVAAGLLMSPLIANPLAKARPDVIVQMRAAAVNQRLAIWQVVTERIFEKPVAGWGVAATRTTAKSIVNDMGIYKKWEQVYHPHNMALEIWLDTGLIGVILALGFLWAIFNRVMDCRYTLALFIAVISIGVVGYGMWQSWWFGMLFILSLLKTVSVRDKAVA